MAKTISAALKLHIAGSTTTLCTCWLITRRDGVVYAFTEHDTDLVVSGTTYTASLGYTRTALASHTDMTVDNSELRGILDDTILTEADLNAGLLDMADVRVFVVNYADTTQGILKMRRGTLGDVILSPTGEYQTELRGLNQKLANMVGELWSPDCRADLGDTRCKIPIKPYDIARSTAYAVGVYVGVITNGAFTGQRRYENRIYKCTTAGTTSGTQPTYDRTVGHTTTDGTAVFTCFSAWTRTGFVATVVNYNQTITVTFDEGDNGGPDGWFSSGVITWETGANIGRSMEVKGSVSATRALLLFLPMDSVIDVNDRFRVSPGCNQLLATCRDKFANVVNMRAEPYTPGIDAITASATLANQTSPSASGSLAPPVTNTAGAGAPVPVAPDTGGQGLNTGAGSTGTDAGGGFSDGLNGGGGSDIPGQG